MSHEIQAYKNGVDLKCARNKLEQDGDVEEYWETTRAAYLVRSAGNPLARVMYIILDVQQFDGGCSGLGDERLFTMDEIKSAWAFLDENEDDLAAIEGIPADFKQLMKSLGAVLMTSPRHEPDLHREREFLQACVDEMHSSKTDTILISFA